MDRYASSAPTAATAATADNAIAQLWNASSTRTIYLREIGIFKTTAGAADIPRLRRTSARGTASTSYTPDITNHFDHALAPASGVLHDLAFSVQPTFLGTGARGLFGAVVPGAIGSGIVWVFPDTPIAIKAGQGIALTTGSALAFPVAESYFVWDE